MSGRRDDCRSRGPRWVGDPVDVVTGEVRDIAQDLRIAGRRPFVWERSYQSFRAAHENRGIGRGHRHSLDWSLRVTVDGMRLETPQDAVLFPHFDSDREHVWLDGWRLERLDALHFTLHRKGEPDRAFTRLEAARRDLRLWKLSYAGSGETLIEYGDSYGHEIKSIRDTNGWVARLSWQDGLLRAIDVADATSELGSIRYEYDDNGCLVAGVDVYGHRFAWAYDADGRVVRKTDRRGYAFVFDYDERGRCTRSAGEDGVDATRLEYAAKSFETVVVHESNEARWVYRYAPSGDLLEIVEPFGVLRTFVYDDAGRLTTQFDGRGQAWEVVRDWTGMAVALRDPFGALHHPDEDPNEPSVDPLARTLPTRVFDQEFGFDHPPVFHAPLREALESLVPAVIAGSLTSGEYVGVERVIRDRSGLRLRTEKTYADGSVARSIDTYDANGNRRKTADYDGSRAEFAYASWNQRVSITDAMGHVTRFTYTPRDRVSDVIDPGGTRTSFFWDDRDRLVAVERHGRVRERYVRDECGALVEKRGAHNERLVRYARGPLGTLKVRRCDDATETFRRDRRGRITEATRTTSTSSHTISRRYDELGRPIEDLRDGAGVTRWSDGSMVRRLTFVPPKAEKSRAFVIESRIFGSGYREIVDPSGHVHRLMHTGRGIVTCQFAHGTSETWQYAPSGVCLAKVTWGPTSIWRRRFVRSPSDRLQYREDDRRGVTRYTYDAARRVTSMQLRDGSIATYVYDEAGNLIAKPGLSEFVDETRGSTQIARAPGNRIYRANDDRFVYDDRDHVIAREGDRRSVHYVRDAIGRLLEIRERTLQGAERSVWTAEYDALGRRVKKRWLEEDIWRTQTFFWDGERLAAEILPDGALRLYIYASDDALIPLCALHYASAHDDPATGALYVFQTDHRGVIERVEDASGTTVWEADIGPFGECSIRVGGDMHQPFRLVGQYHDQETGLSAHRYRHWSPELGRFLESDPIGLAGGINVYAWPGDPLHESDPQGLGCPESEDGEAPTSRRSEEADAEEAPASRPPRREGAPPEVSPAILARAREREVAASEAYNRMTPSQREGKTVAVDGIAVANGQAARQPKGLHNRTADINGTAMVAHTQAIGHPTPGHFADRSVPGQTTASHAERLVARQHAVDAANGGTPTVERPIGVSRDTCGSCREYLRRDAMHTGNTTVVADPHHTRVYHPDGTVDVYDPNNNLVQHVPPPTAQAPQTPQANRNVYQGIPW